MLIALAIVTAVATSSADVSPAPFHFSRSYGVWVGSYQGRCTYFLTDVGEDAEKLTHTLQEGYDITKGLEVLTNDYSLSGCAAGAVRAARKAGFKHVRIRRGAESDRLHGIP